jgi:methylated-DNA-[protein]-cysteine S-methyltransferase
MKHSSHWVQSTVSTPLGDMRLAASAVGLAGAWFISGQRHLPPDEHIASWLPSPDHPVLLAASEQLSAYFRSERQAFDLPLDLSSGTPFQQAVWHALLGIASGHTLSYGGVAHGIHRPAAVRAVGAAIGRNPLSIIVPCHRVIGASGALTGYAGGLDRKAALLRLEGGGSLPI